MGVPRGQWQIPNNFDPSTPPPKSDRARMPVNLITRISDKSEIEFHLTKSIVAIDEILDSYFNRYTKPFEQISAIEI